jgi:hypothetical protein
MDMNPGVTILLANEGRANIMVNHNGRVWSKDYENAADAVKDAVEARLVHAETAATLLKELKGYVGAPLHYYPPALRACGFREFPAED